MKLVNFKSKLVLKLIDKNLSIMAHKNEKKDNRKNNRRILDSVGECGINSRSY